TVLDFLIVAFTIFLMIKVINRLNRQAESKKLQQKKSQ
ncbi:MAG: MscL family protein, partial [Candidatus Omnitrophica bacterium]|nr:MscL family protein [Candidatus Omnitrophota bacterium]